MSLGYPFPFAYRIRYTPDPLLPDIVEDLGTLYFVAYANSIELEEAVMSKPNFLDYLEDLGITSPWPFKICSGSPPSTCITLSLLNDFNPSKFQYSLKLPQVFYGPGPDPFTSGELDQFNLGPDSLSILTVGDVGPSGTLASNLLQSGTVASSISWNWFVLGILLIILFCTFVYVVLPYEGTPNFILWR
jgi:hypothetical protein